MRVTRSAICGSDLHFFHGKAPMSPGEGIGHEAVGVVEEVGSGRHPVRGRRPGRRGLRHRVRRVLVLRARPDAALRGLPQPRRRRVRRRAAGRAGRASAGAGRRREPPARAGRRRRRGRDLRRRRAHDRLVRGLDRGARRRGLGRRRGAGAGRVLHRAGGPRAGATAGAGARPRPRPARPRRRSGCCADRRDGPPPGDGGGRGHRRARRRHRDRGRRAPRRVRDGRRRRPPRRPHRRRRHVHERDRAHAARRLVGSGRSTCGSAACAPSTRGGTPRWPSSRPDASIPRR